jgi:CubicO group peptidase (beta-lactamase class C family)
VSARPGPISSSHFVLRWSVPSGKAARSVFRSPDSNLVVDIWAGIADLTTGREVKADTLFPTFSVIKAVTVTALHIQVSRGLVDYDAPVARYWPEFAANGKDRVTVRHVLHHRSGVWQMPEAVTPERLADYDWMVDAIASLSPLSEPGTRNGYQSLTFGWMISEVVRRTDPKGRSFRTYVQEEITQPLGIDDLWMGVPASEHPRVARLIDAPPRQLPPMRRRSVPSACRLAPVKISLVARMFAKAACRVLVALRRPARWPAPLRCQWRHSR